MNHIVVVIYLKNSDIIYAKNTYKNKKGNIFKISKAKYM